MDSEDEMVGFGTLASALQVSSSSVTTRSFAFVIGNSINEVVRNVNWSCSENIYNNTLFNLSGFGNSSYNLSHTYVAIGSGVFACNVFSDDGNDFISVDIDISGLAVEDYDVLYENASRRVSYFSAFNHFNALSASLNVSGNEISNTDAFSIGAEDFIAVIFEANYSVSGNKELVLSLSSNVSNVSYVDSFVLKGAVIRNYTRGFKVIIRVR